MERTTLNDVIADLRGVGLSSGPDAHLPKGSRPPAEMLDRWARAAANQQTEQGEQAGERERPAGGEGT